MPAPELKCVICGNDKVETTVFIRLVKNGVDAVACSGCMPVVIHGPKGHGHRH